MYTLKYLVFKSSECQAEINGKWVPSRPIPFHSLRYRLKDAWEVFMGRADAFTWPEGQ